MSDHGSYFWVGYLNIILIFLSIVIMIMIFYDQCIIKNVANKEWIYTTCYIF